MDDIIRYQRVTSYILKEQLGSLTLEEAGELAAWLAENEDHRRRYERLKHKNFDRELEEFRAIDASGGWRKYNRRYPRRGRRVAFWYGVAAAVVLLVSLGVWQFAGRGGEGVLVATGDIQPGKSHAELVLEDGSVRTLEMEPLENVILLDGVIAHHAGGNIRYERVATGDERQGGGNPEYNMMVIPTGGEFVLTLEDGTKVWLNSETTLRYPVVFTGGKREVYLDGEAYFEVARDERHPFIVRTRDNVEVRVLGTSFNVRAYEDEEYVETVLEEGSVRVSRDSSVMVLVPGSLCVSEARGMRTRMVDTEVYTAWRDGQFVFQDESLVSILTKLSRWYKMEVFYQNEEVKHLVFSGSVRKYETINNLLKALELSDEVRFEVRGTTVIVSSK